MHFTDLIKIVPINTTPISEYGKVQIFTNLASSLQTGTTNAGA